jgi:hypothetical protein
MTLYSIDPKHRKYWDGNDNKAIRYYFYIQRGLALLNEFRYLIMAVLAVYALLKLEDWWLMPIMFFGSIPVLLFLGWISVHRMSRVMDYLSVQFGTHFGRYSVELQEKTLEVLEKLEKKLNTPVPVTPADERRLEEVAP